MALATIHFSIACHTHDTLYTMSIHSKKPPSKLEEYHKKEILNLHTCLTAL
jgi:hypothetical protein